MKEIPGSAPDCDTTLHDHLNKPLERPRTQFEAITESGRWNLYGQPASFVQKQKKYAAQQTPQTVGRGAQEHVVYTTAKVPLAHCMTGKELVAGVESGKLYPFAARVVHAATNAHPVKWKLRGTRLAVLRLMMTVQCVKKKRGLIATHAQIARAVGLKDPDWIGRIVADLREWCLLRQDDTFVPHTKSEKSASSRRACVFQLTQEAFRVFDLGRLRGVEYDQFAEPEIGFVAKKKRREQRRADAETQLHDSERDLKTSTSSTNETNDVQIPPAGVVAQTSLYAPVKGPEHPDTDATPGVLTNLPGDRSSSASLVVSASPTLDFYSTTPADSSAVSFPGMRQDETCEVSRKPALQAGVAESAHDASVAAERAPRPAELPSVVDDAWIEAVNLPPMLVVAKPMRELVPRVSTPGHGAPSKRRTEVGPEQRPRVEWERDNRQAGRELAKIARLEKRRAVERPAAQAAPPRAEDDAPDSWGEVAEASLEQARRDELERYKRSLEEHAPERANRPVRPRVDPHDDFDAVIQRANASFEQNRHRTVGAWMRNRRKPIGGAS